MTHAWRLALTAIGIVCLTQGFEGQGLPQYRDFSLGSDLASVAGRAGLAPATAKTVHQRPALLQELEWRPSYWVGVSTTASVDPVEQILFSFYNDQLFRLVVDYGRERTEGLTVADMIEAISAAYGTPLTQTSRLRSQGVSRLDAESGTAVATWGDTEQSVVLYRTSTYNAAFRLMVTGTRLGDLARKAETEAKRLDYQEAPQREVARQKKEQDDGRAAAEKARISNKATFRP